MDIAPEIRKNIEKLSEICRKHYNDQVDITLCHLLYIIGVWPEDNLEKNKDIFDEIIDLLSAIKSKLIKKKLTVTTSEDVE